MIDDHRGVDPGHPHSENVQSALAQLHRQAFECVSPSCLSDALSGRVGLRWEELEEMAQRTRKASPGPVRAEVRSEIRFANHGLARTR